MSDDAQPQRIELEIANKLGLHARAAAVLRELAQGFESDIKVIKDHMEADAKSLLGLIALGASQGSVITIEATGSDAEKALEELKTLVENKFDEGE